MRYYDVFNKRIFTFNKCIFIHIKIYKNVSAKRFFKRLLNVTVLLG